MNDEVLVRAVVGSTAVDLFHTQDHLYSTTAVYYAMSGSFGIQERYEYDAYGKATVYTNMADWNTANPTTQSYSTIGNPYTFTGRRLDTLDNAGHNVMYYRARYYDTDTGRFMQRDPLIYVDSMSLYEYVSSLPLVNFDPTGTKIVSELEVDYWIHNNMPYRRKNCKKKGCCIRHIGRMEFCEFKKKIFRVETVSYQWMPGAGGWWKGNCKKTLRRYLIDKEKFTGRVVNFQSGWWKSCTYTIEVATVDNPYDGGKRVIGSSYTLHVYKLQLEEVFLKFDKSFCEKNAKEEKDKRRFDPFK